MAGTRKVIVDVDPEKGLTIEPFGATLAERIVLSDKGTEGGGGGGPMQLSHTSTYRVEDGVPFSDRDVDME